MSDESVEQWRQADEEVRKNLPPGVKLVRTLRGHKGTIGRIAWSPGGRMLASPSEDETIRLWDAETGECLRTLEGHKSFVSSIAFDPTGRTLASSGWDGTVRLWDPTNGKLLRTLKHKKFVFSVAFNPAGRTLASAADNGTVKLWDPTNGKLLRTLLHRECLFSVAFDPAGCTLASSGENGTVKLWDPTNGKLLRILTEQKSPVYCVVFNHASHELASGGTERTVKIWEPAKGKLELILEGHTSVVDCLDFSATGGVLASKSDDQTVRIWRCDSWQQVAVIPETKGNDTAQWPGLAFHPHLPLLATVGSDLRTLEAEITEKSLRDGVIHIWELDLAVLLGQPEEPSAHYVNAKVVLVGDTGVGKTGLSLVLNNQPFRDQGSTPGRRVWTFDSREVEVGGNVTQTRETLLWDLAGQPGYRVIHQLHLNEVAVALWWCSTHAARPIPWLASGTGSVPCA